VSNKVGNRCGGRAPPYPRLSFLRRIVVPRLGGLEKASPHPLGNQNTVGAAALATPLGACGHDPLADTSALGSPVVARVLTGFFWNFWVAHEAPLSSTLTPCVSGGALAATPLAAFGQRCQYKPATAAALDSPGVTSIAAWFSGNYLEAHEASSFSPRLPQWPPWRSTDIQLKRGHDILCP